MAMPPYCHVIHDDNVCRIFYVDECNYLVTEGDWSTTLLGCYLELSRYFTDLGDAVRLVNYYNELSRRRRFATVAYVLVDGDYQITQFVPSEEYFVERVQLFEGYHFVTQIRHTYCLADAIQAMDRDREQVFLANGAC